MLNDQKEAHRSACLIAGALAVELSDMIERFPKINTEQNQADFPYELIAVWQSLGAARSAMMDFEQSVREARVAA